MMLNKSLFNFGYCIHNSLKIQAKDGIFTICETANNSQIKKIFFNKGNCNDILIIRQDTNNCKPIEHLFNKMSKVKSCDFIALNI